MEESLSAMLIRHETKVPCPLQLIMWSQSIRLVGLERGIIHIAVMDSMVIGMQNKE